jgi:hypothetical protein
MTAILKSHCYHNNGNDVIFVNNFELLEDMWYNLAQYMWYNKPKSRFCHIWKTVLSHLKSFKKTFDQCNTCNFIKNHLACAKEILFWASQFCNTRTTSLSKKVFHGKLVDHTHEKVNMARKTCFLAMFTF